MAFHLSSKHFDALPVAAREAADALAMNTVRQLAALNLPLDTFARAVKRMRTIARDVAAQAAKERA